MVDIKKVSSVLIVLLVTVMFLLCCKKKNPEIQTTITLENISEKEYESIKYLSNQEKGAREDYKKLTAHVEITNSKKAVERMINIPNLYIINEYDGLRVINGQSESRNNVGKEETADCLESIIFNSKGLSEQNIRNIYNDSVIYIAYRLKDSEVTENKVSIGKETIIKEQGFQFLY
jgi:predicted  nucleic acid-binding Zn-ribbon protein